MTRATATLTKALPLTSLYMYVYDADVLYIIVTFAVGPQLAKAATLQYMQI
jgi:hypothetical protein